MNRKSIIFRPAWQEINNRSKWKFQTILKLSGQQVIKVLDLLKKKKGNFKTLKKNPFEFLWNPVPQSPKFVYMNVKSEQNIWCPVQQMMHSCTNVQLWWPRFKIEMWLPWKFLLGNVNIWKLHSAMIYLLIWLEATHNRDGKSMKCNIQRLSNKKCDM